MENFPDISEHLHIHEGFCHPDWGAVYDAIEAGVSESDKHAAWEHAARLWLSLNAKHLGPDYQLHTTENFMLLTAASMRVAKDACRSCEHALKEIMDMMEGVAADEGYGKHVVIMFSKVDDYYRYISHYYPDGNHATSSGMCLHGGYNHLVFPSEDYFDYRAVTAHELTHICLSHLPIPTWIDEALAMTMEEVVCGVDMLRLDRERYEEHVGHWNPETIQEFWNGMSWARADLGFTLAYSLGQVLWRKIEKDLSASREEIVRFVRQATYEDGGEAAFRAVFDLSLGALVEDFLGEGDWEPKPGEWPQEEPVEDPPVDS